MKYFRGLVAIVVGYLILAGVSMSIVASLFGTGLEPETSRIWVSMAGLAFGALVGGFLCTLIAGTANNPAIYITLGVVVVMAARAHFMQEGIEPDWYRLIGTVVQCVGFLVGASAAAYRMER